MKMFENLCGFDYDAVILSNNGQKAFCINWDGLVILDITNTHNPSEIGRYKVDRAMFIEVCADEKKAYITVGNKGLVIVDISDQANPTKVGSYDTDGVTWGVALSSDGTKAYVVNTKICTNWVESHLITIDISDTSNPSMICDKHIAKNFGHGVKLSNDGKKAFISCGEYLEVVTL